MLGLAVEDRADLDLLDAGVNDDICVLVVIILSLDTSTSAGFSVHKILAQIPADQALVHGLDDLLAVPDVENLQAGGGAAVILPDDHILGNVTRRRVR